jgi:hypothetical protein
MFMAPEPEVNFHFSVSLNRCIAGQSSNNALIEIQAALNWTRTSFTPLTDVRSARISCTSQRYGSLGVGEVEVAVVGEVEVAVVDKAVVLDMLCKG